MNKCIRILPFTKELFDQEDQAQKAARIMHGILEAHSGRLTTISHKMKGNPAGNYKLIQRFIKQVDLKDVLLKLFQEQAEFVIGDPTEMARSQAKKTEYVGKLSDGSTLGYWLLLLATPFRGRAIPCSFVTYSSKTINQGVNSRNQEHARAFESVKALLGERPLVLDREFSYLELLDALIEEQIHFVIRLKKTPSGPKFTDEHGQEVKLNVGMGQQVIYRDVYYMGEARVNVIGIWRRGLSRPLWVMTDLEPEEGLRIYLKRMKIEESFKDVKDLLGIGKIMNKRQEYMEQMVALVLLAYSIVLMIGEAIRDKLYGPAPTEVQKAGKSWRLYSGPFIVLRQKIPLANHDFRLLLNQVRVSFSFLLFGDVRTHVST
jgi:hypothetical protein